MIHHFRHHDPVHSDDGDRDGRAALDHLAFRGIGSHDDSLVIKVGDVIDDLPPETGAFDRLLCFSGCQANDPGHCHGIGNLLLLLFGRLFLYSLFRLAFLHRCLRRSGLFILLR